MLRKILFGLLAVFLIIQIFQIEKTNPAYDQNQDLLLNSNASPEIAGLIKKACYDCHSSQTTYPWYSYIQPVGWFLQNHVKEGRHKFNFSQWTTYQPRRQAKIFHECSEEVGEGEMPLNSYIIMHPEANLTDAQRKMLVAWFDGNGKTGTQPNLREEEENDND